MNDTEKYSSGNYEKYVSKNVLKRAMIQNFNRCFLQVVTEEYKRLLAKFPSFKGEVNVLDMGCGEGFISNILFESIPRCKITGIDFSGKAIEKAKESNNEINFITGSIYEIPFKDEYFNIVVCTEVLEHLADPLNGIKELLRVTSQGGNIIISVPNEPFFCLGNLISLKNISRLGNPIDHINHWTTKGFMRWLEKNSVKINSCYAPFPWTIITCIK